MFNIWRRSQNLKAKFNFYEGHRTNKCNQIKKMEILKNTKVNCYWIKHKYNLVSVRLHSSNKMSSTTTERSPAPLAGTRRRRRARDRRRGNLRAATTGGRAKRTRRLSRACWESCPKTESPRRHRTPRAPAWRREEVRVRTPFFLSWVQHV